MHEADTEVVGLAQRYAEMRRENGRALQWGELTHLSAEIAAIVMGVTVSDAKREQHQAGKVRKEPVAATAACFFKSQIGRRPRQTRLYRLITDRRDEDLRLFETVAADCPALGIKVRQGGKAGQRVYVGVDEDELHRLVDLARKVGAVGLAA